MNGLVWGDQVNELLAEHHVPCRKQLTAPALGPDTTEWLVDPQLRRARATRSQPHSVKSKQQLSSPPSSSSSSSEQEEEEEEEEECGSGGLCVVRSAQGNKRCRGITRRASYGAPSPKRRRRMTETSTTTEPHHSQQSRARRRHSMPASTPPTSTSTSSTTTVRRSARLAKRAAAV
eukprot:TRINITY_DN7248_c4_g1_i1.p1 TRINITY_DN7248_c4_g1~~TRINITY_DN7248_c4_g1_i1.p1  ORF type:complete len:176 (+),score=60.38 TRINITY_DN7248_c4_g1_i1:149-676(+)